MRKEGRCFLVCWASSGERVRVRVTSAVFLDGRGRWNASDAGDVGGARGEARSESGTIESVMGKWTNLAICKVVARLLSPLQLDPQDSIGGDLNLVLVEGRWRAPKHVECVLTCGWSRDAGKGRTRWKSRCCRCAMAMWICWSEGIRPRFIASVGETVGRNLLFSSFKLFVSRLG